MVNMGHVKGAVSKLLDIEVSALLVYVCAYKILMGKYPTVLGVHYKQYCVHHKVILEFIMPSV